MRNKKPAMVYGIRAVMESLQSGQHLEKIFIQKNLKGELIRELYDLLSETETPVLRVPIERINKFTGKNHQGVVAFLSPVQYHNLSNLVAGVYEKGEQPFFVLLDRITDVRNFGAIARTAEGTGVHGVIIPAKGSAQINEDSMKTSAGALSTLPITRSTNLLDTVKFMKDSGFTVVGCTEKTTKFLYDANLKDIPIVIVLGSEENGISSDILEQCHQKVQIPMKGQIGSFNVSVAAAICFYEVLRQRS